MRRAVARRAVVVFIVMVVVWCEVGKVWLWVRLSSSSG